MRLRGAVLLLLFGALAGGCGALDGPARLAGLPLPDPATLPCCWQSQEQVWVSTADGELNLGAAVAVRGGTLTVVVLDPMGRRLVTLIQGAGDVQTLDAPPAWSGALSHQLLLAIYLHHLTAEQWRLGDPAWSLAADSGHKSLAYRGRELVRLDYLEEGTQEPFDRAVEFRGQGISLRIGTLSRTAL